VSTDWIPVRHVSWEEFLALGLETEPVESGTLRVRVADWYGLARRTAAGGLLYEEYGAGQCNENRVRSRLRELLGTDLVSYIGELNDHGNYPDRKYPDYEELHNREYPKT